MTTPNPGILPAIGLALVGPLVADTTLLENFDGDLSAYTSTVILDANGGGANVAAWQIADAGDGENVLRFDTTTYDGIEQVALIRDGLALQVGEEVRVKVTHNGASQDLGLYVGGTPPTAGVRQDYVSVYARATGEIFSRGFDGATEYGLVGAGVQTFDTLFIARVDTNTYDAGYYNAGARTIVATRIPVTPNDADVIGFYSDVRALGTLGDLDDFCVTDIPPDFIIELDITTFASGLETGDPVATLTSFVSGAPDNSTFVLVAGEGATDNDKFQIAGDELQVGAFDFSGTNDGDPFMVRVEATAEGGGATHEQAFVLTVRQDEDVDNLPDSWELMWDPDENPSLDHFSAVEGTEDFDGDDLYDVEEYQLFSGTYDDRAPMPTLDPANPDSDGDGLKDGEEVIFPVGLRPATNPVEPDTDFDGLTDFEETNSMTTETPPAAGTDPTRVDSDGDGAKDGFEIDNGTDPLLGTSFPGSVSPDVTVVRITDDATSGISAAKNYTHAISGGYATTVNGVTFEALGTATTPANFLWELDPGPAGNEIAAANLGNWVPLDGGLPDDGSADGIIDLLSGFTYADSSDLPGDSQSYTLEGLTIGQEYSLRLYYRAWRPASDSGRPIDLTFINGESSTTPFCSILLDRPAYALAEADPAVSNQMQAYFINFSYVAQDTRLVIETRIPLGADADDSHHLYGLTNETVGPIVTPTDLRITGAARDGSGNIVIDFVGAPDTIYQVTKSDLSSAFVPLTVPLSPMTAANGTGQAVVPAGEASETEEFYRIEE